MKACQGGTGISQKSRVLSAHLGRDKTRAMVVVRWYFPHIFTGVAEIIKYCDVCQHVNTYKLPKGNKTLHTIPVPLKAWSLIGIDL